MAEIRGNVSTIYYKIRKKSGWGSMVADWLN